MTASTHARSLDGPRQAFKFSARRFPAIVSMTIVWLLSGTFLAQDAIPRSWSPIAPAAAQSPDDAGADESDFSVDVYDPQQIAERIPVSLNRQIVITTSEPFDRVEAVGADIVRIDPMTPTTLLVTGIDFGVTQVVLWTASGEQRVFEINVELDLDMLNSTIKDLDPQSEARAISVMGNIMLLGTVSGVDVAQAVNELATMFVPRIKREGATVFNLLRVSGEQQVHLKCVVAEVSRAAIRKLGINWFLAGENFRDGFVVNQIGGINPINIQPVAGSTVSRHLPFVVGDVPISSQANLTLGFPRANLSLFIRAMADNQLARILAEPTLVAVSGETATFLVGGEFPVPIPQSGSSSGAITIEFKEFGVNLKFTPLVLPDQRVRLTVRPEISARDETRGLTTGSGFVPAITTRRAETTVELETGSTIAIAGLLQDEVRGVASGVPGINGIPILGALFRTVDYQRLRTELVILVTPEIVASMGPEDIPDLPGAGLKDPTDLELFLLGSLEGKDPLEDEFELPLDGELPPLDGQMGLWRSEPDLIPLHGPWGASGENEAVAAVPSSSGP